VCLASHKRENVIVEMTETTAYQAKILLVGGPANGLKIKLINELDAAEGGV
jgi:hypothetical protein